MYLPFTLISGSVYHVYMCVCTCMCANACACTYTCVNACVLCTTLSRFNAYSGPMTGAYVCCVQRILIAYSGCQCVCMGVCMCVWGVWVCVRLCVRVFTLTLGCMWMLCKLFFKYIVQFVTGTCKLVMWPWWCVFVLYTVVSGSHLRAW